MISTRSAANEDRLAKAKANALRRRQEKAAAQGGSASAIQSPAIPSTPPRSTAISEMITPRAADRTTTTTTRGSPFGNLFEPPAADETPKRPSTILATPTSAASISASISASASASRPSFMSNVDPPPDTSPVPSRYVSSGLSSSSKPPPTTLLGFGPPPAAGGGPKDRYGSISKTDRRRLGRHLPRIASGGEGWDEDEGARVPTDHARVPSGLSKPEESAPIASTAKEVPPPAAEDRNIKGLTVSQIPSTPTRHPRAMDVLTPSKNANIPPKQTQMFTTSTPSASVFGSSSSSASASVPSTPTAAKRRSAYMGSTDKPFLPSKVGLTSPRPEVAGADMKGLMSAVGNMSARGGPKDDNEGVTGT